MKKLLVCTVVLLAAVLLLTTGALAYDPLSPPQPGAADGWYETEATFYMTYGDQPWSEMSATLTTYEYNDAGLPVKSTEISTDSDESSDYLYEYDSQGRLIRSVRTDGNHEMRYDYRDDGSYLMIYTWWSDDETQADARTSYRTYDPQVGWYWYGSFRFELDDKGMIARRWNEDVEYVYTTAYDAQGRVSKVTVENTQDHTVYTDEYTYYDDGYTMREGTKTGYEEFIYDKAGRLIKYVFGYEDNVPPYEYFYDDAGNCIEVRGSQRRWTYAYEQPGAQEQPGFTDVTNPEAFYYTPVYWAVKNGVTNGTSPTTFGPDATCTRGQVVTFLWRAAGSPEPTSTGNPFTDLKPGAFYEKAVAWAVENNITSGTSPTTFSPDKGCTRGQVVAFLWRAAGSPEPTSTSNPFTDLKPGAFYEKAVAWAVENKVTSGTSRTAFSPDATCTRGQIVTFLYRAFA